MKILFISVAIAIVVGVIADLARRIPVCNALIDNGGGVRLLSHAAPDLWWIVTLYYNGWGVEIFYYPKPYWSPTVGYTRQVGVCLHGVHVLVALGRTGRKGDDLVFRTTPSRKWYEFQI